MRRSLVRETTDNATRLVAVQAARRVFVVRRFGVDSILRAQGIATSLGATAVQIAKAQIEAEETNAQIAENVDHVRETAGDAAAEHERSQLEELASQQAAKLTVDEQIALYTDQVFPLVAACVTHIGELKAGLELDGVLPTGTKPEDVCTDLGGAFIEPVRLVFGDEADPEKGELAIWTFGPHIIGFGNAVIQAATDFHTVTLPVAEPGVVAAGGQVGTPVRATPLRDAFGPRPASGRA